MKLSIITCTYNSDKYLQECINSVISQKLNTNIYEHIFVDAFSTDNTKNIINNYKKLYNNVKFIECKPKGVYNAMNNGIKIAHGEYIMCINSDDWLEKDILKKYLSFVEDTGNSDIYYGKVEYSWDELHHYTNLDNFIGIREFLYRNFGCNVLIGHPSTLIKRDLFFSDIGLFDETKKIASDYGLLLKCLINKKNITYFPNTITHFRIHEGSLSTNGKNEKKAHEETLYFKKKYLPIHKAYISNIIDYLVEILGKIISYYKS